MIFADKLIKLRKKSGWSQEELAEKLDVSRQTISKWEGALSMPDLNRMLKIAQLFGVTTDYLMKDDQELEECKTYDTEDDYFLRCVSMEEAVEFIHIREYCSKLISFGVLLCIYACIPLIVLSDAQEMKILAVSEHFVAGIGCVCLFLMVALAVGMFIYSGMKLSGYEHLEKDLIDTAYGVEEMVKERKKQYAAHHSRLLIGGIIMCVLCPVPLFVVIAMLGENNEWAMTLAVASLLFMIGIGVLCIVRTCIVWGSFQVLLEEGDYRREKKTEHHRNDAITVIYWGIVTALYLGYSFITNDWGRSWIIWPVTGVLFGVLESLLTLFRKNTPKA